MKTKLTRTDLKFYPSERLSDRPDAGGLALGTPIKGEANEIFNPISSLARTNGDYEMRLVYAGVQRADDELLIGANVAITKPPTDDSVSYLLTHAQFGELRKSGVSRVEGYVTKSFESNLTLLSSPPKGSKMIQAYTRVGEKLPNVGDRFCLSQAKQGYEQAAQYINIVKVESTERTFTDPQGAEFSRLVVKLEISQPLAYDFIGVDYPSRYYVDNPCKIRETAIADSSRYFGVKPLATAVKAGAMSIRVPNIMAKIVPTAMIETSLTELSPLPIAPQFFALPSRQSFGGVGIQAKIQLPPFMAGSLIIESYGGQMSDKDGKLMLGEQAIGVVDNATGVVTIDPNVRHYIAGINIIPSVVTYANTQSHAIFVALANRGYTYNLTLPNVGVGSMAVQFMAQGKWYQLKDNGQGKLIGASTEHGSGTVSYKTGLVSVTCGEMPDVGSSILFSWGIGANLTALEPHALPATAHFKLEQSPKFDSIRLDLGGYTGTVGANGKITGQLTGFYDEINNEIVLDVGSSAWHSGINIGNHTLKVQYQTGTKTQKEFTTPTRNGGGQIVVKLSDTAVLAGSVALSATAIMSDVDKSQLQQKGVVVQIPKGAMTVLLKDDGAGKLIDVNGDVVGTMDYETATATFKPDYKSSILEQSVKTEHYQTTHIAPVSGGGNGILGRFFVNAQNHIRHFNNGYQPKEITAMITGASTITAQFYERQAGESHSQTFAVNEVRLTVAKPSHTKLAMGSLRLAFANDHYLYDELGGIYKDYNATTGQGTKIGTVDYDTGVITINQLSGWTGGRLLTGLIAQKMSGALDELHFNTPVAPIRPSSLQITATLLDGQSVTATANQDGQLTGDNLVGVVDSKTGIAHIRFGKWVTAAGNENKVWYDPKAVVDGQIWQPVPVLADSIKYNAIATRELPIDSSIIKIDTVRLPQDGQVPIFRLGDTILIGNRQTTNIGSAFTGGQTIQLPRQNLDRICVKDSNGKPLDANLYDDDLENGTVTFKSPLDLSGYKLPLVAMHAVEEKNRLANTDIDGTLTLMFPLRNNYEVDNTYVSSVLAHGNLQVNSSIPFTQKNWNGKWADEPVGDPLLNRLNVKDYPIILTDDGAINERWLIKFTSSTQFELYGETLGFVMRTDILQNLTPINPSTGKPYFTLDKRAFGGSDTAGSQGQVAWASQDVIRFNTEGTLMPFWIIRAVAPNQNKQVGDDGFGLCIFGDTTEQ